MKKRKTIPFEFIAGLGYFHFKKVSYNGIDGYLYILCNKLTKEQKETINSYKNTKISSCYNRYAKEIQHDVIFVGNKCFK